MTYPCPFCLVPASAESGCPSCGRPADPDAIEVAHADAEIAELTPRLAAARQTAQSLEARLGQVWSRRQAAAARVRASVLAARPVAAPPAAAPVAPVAPHAPRRSAEASTRLVQNTLFLLGGLLLAIAAIVFTAVAWAQFGVGGRAALLGLFTGAALAVPPLAVRRKLTATAETFAAVGLLLTLLDGYAAWYVNLFGIADSSPWGYAGAVGAVTAAVAAGYAHLTGLTGPRFAALLIAQPVLPLLVVPAHPDAAGWAFTFAGVALLNLAVTATRRDAVTWAAYAAGGLAVLAAAFAAGLGLAVAVTVGPAAIAGAALVLTASIVLAGTIVAHNQPARTIAAALLVVAAGLAAGRVAVLLTPATPLIRVAAVTLIVALLVAVAHRRWPSLTAGPRIGAYVVIGGPGLLVLALTADAAARSLAAARPFFHAALDRAVPSAGGSLPVAIALIAAAVLVLVPARGRRDTVLVAAGAVALALPAGLHLYWWVAPILDLLVAAVALALAVRHVAPPLAAAVRQVTPPLTSAVRQVTPVLAVPAGSVAAAPVAASPSAASAAGHALSAAANAGPSLAGAAAFAGQVVAAGLLGLHSLMAGFGQPAVAAGVLAAIAVLGFATAVLGRRAELAGAGMFAALLALPAIAWTAGAALDATPAVQARAVLAVTVVLAALPHRWTRRRRSVLAATLVTVVPLPLWAALSGDPTALYAAAALLLLAPIARAGSAAAPGSAAAGSAAAGRPAQAGRAARTGRVGAILARAGVVPAGHLRGLYLLGAGLAAVLPGLTLLVAVLPSLYGILLRPYTQLDLTWTGRLPAAPHVPVAHAVAALVVALAAASLGRRHALPILAVTVPLAVASAAAPWPVGPATALLLGLAALVFTALRSTEAVALPIVGGLLALAGLASALPTRAATLAALGSVLIAAVVTGVSGRAFPARAAGWLIAVAAGVGVARTAGSAAGLDLLTTAFLVLVVGALALAVAWLPLAGRPAEARLVEAAGHAAAVLALLLTVGSAGHAAAVCTLWGLALGVRAVQAAAHRPAYLIAAAGAELGGWLLLMAAAEVTTLEAYTIPSAAVALLAGLLARRRRPKLSSWTAYGPALAGALLPSLASVLVGDGQHLRRLLLGLAALLVVLAGANARLRAPVLLGGGVLLLVGLHELAQVWDLIPRWIPLAAGGLLLVLLATTLERRRRDLARFRAAITRMS